MGRKKLIYIGFFTVLVAIFLFMLNKLIPGFQDTRFPPIGTVQPFAFTNQDGEQVTNKNVEGKIFVAEYFFTTCTGICPVMNTNMRNVYEHFKGQKNFMILSHTCDPDNDSVAQIKHYADSMQVDTKQWIFLTGRKDSLYNMARYSYKIDDPKNNVGSIKDQFLHTQFWALVDRKGDIRKVYDGLKKKEINAMMKDIENLLKGKE